MSLRHYCLFPVFFKEEQRGSYFNTTTSKLNDEKNLLLSLGQMCIFWKEKFLSNKLSSSCSFLLEEILYLFSHRKLIKNAIKKRWSYFHLQGHNISKWFNHSANPFIDYTLPMIVSWITLVDTPNFSFPVQEIHRKHVNIFKKRKQVALNLFRYWYAKF